MDGRQSGITSGATVNQEQRADIRQKFWANRSDSRLQVQGEKIRGKGM
jgi:hypothetical protein